MLSFFHRLITPFCSICLFIQSQDFQKHTQIMLNLLYGGSRFAAEALVNTSQQLSAQVSSSPSCSERSLLTMPYIESQAHSCTLLSGRCFLINLRVADVQGPFPHKHRTAPLKSGMLCCLALYKPLGQLLFSLPQKGEERPPALPTMTRPLLRLGLSCPSRRPCFLVQHRCSPLCLRHNPRYACELG